MLQRTVPLPPPMLGQAYLSCFIFSTVILHQANQWCQSLAFLVVDHFNPHQLFLSLAPIAADQPGGLAQCWGDTNKVVALLLKQAEHKSPEHVQLVYLVKAQPSSWQWTPERHWQTRSSGSWSSAPISWQAASSPSETRCCPCPWSVTARSLTHSGCLLGAAAVAAQSAGG